MNRSLWWRFLAISVVFALVMSVVYVAFMRETTSSGRANLQRSILLFAARIVEDGPVDQSMRRLEGYLAESPEVPTQLWVVDEQGRVLASRSGKPPPLDWLRIDKPVRVHELVRSASLSLRGPVLTIVRLQGDEPRYLVARFVGLPGRPILMLQITSFVVALGGALFLGLTLITLYLRARSRQARQVIARLESGDLRARLVPERLDALGALMLDFNRMADEIERLVLRLQAAEDARRGLLQELGHDLRTPLTSLRTSIETLSAHGPSMPAPDREAFFAIVHSELEYFVRLIDDLFFIADIAEPHYRKAAERLDLRELLRGELAAMRGRPAPSAEAPVRFEMADDAPLGDECRVIGDRMLLSRVFRNALDNAAKHARGLVRVSFARGPHELSVIIDDDGPGMSAEGIAAFGRRRHQRLQAGASQPFMSLGLGSVIIKTIVELHGGRWQLRSAAAGDAVQGTRLAITLPCVRPGEPPDQADTASATSSAARP